MNITEYISSGVVENYVLGLATEDERREFEAMCEKHPEVVAARLQFEQALENQLLASAPLPPAALKEKITGTLALRSVSQAAPGVPAKVRSLSFWKLLAVASLAALLGLLIWAISLNTKNKQLKEQNLALQNKSEQAAAQLAVLEKDAQRMQNPNVKMAAMQGTKIAPGAFATVYWDTTTKDVFMMINNLPQPATDKQYQLWALLNNKPVNLGVFEVRQQQLLVKMKNVQNAQAFAVTLERKGGSPAPTMESLYVVGKL